MYVTLDLRKYQSSPFYSNRVNSTKKKVSTAIKICSPINKKTTTNKKKTNKKKEKLKEKLNQAHSQGFFFFKGGRGGYK